MALDLLKRSEKGAALTSAEHDANFDAIETEVNGKAATVHAHVPSTDLTAGGTPDGTTFLRGDDTWASPAGGGDMLAATYDPQAIADDAFARANHTGEQAISTVTGLQTALDAKQPLDAELTALAGLAANGLVARTGAGTVSPRTLMGTASEITVTDGDGVAGNPTIGIDAAVLARTSHTGEQSVSTIEVLTRRLDLTTIGQTYILDAAHKGQRIVFHGAGNDAVISVPATITGEDKTGDVWDGPYWWFICESDVDGTLTLDVDVGAVVDIGSTTISDATELLDTASAYLLVWTQNSGGSAATYSLYRLPGQDGLGPLAAKSVIVWTTDVASATANKFAGWDGSGNPVLKDATGDAAPTRVTVTSANSPYTLTEADRASNGVEILCLDGANNLEVALPEDMTLGSWVIKRGATHSGAVLVRGASANVTIDGIAGPTLGINLPVANSSGVLSMDALNVARWEGPSTQATTSYADHDFGGNQAQNVELSAATLADPLTCAGQIVKGNRAEVLTSVSGALTTADHSGRVLVLSGNVTIPNAAGDVGFNASLIATGAQTVTFNSTTSAAMAAGDVMSVLVQSTTVIKAVLAEAANLVSFT